MPDRSDRTTFTEEVKQKVFDKDPVGRCNACRKNIVFGNRQHGQRGAWNVDHIRPISLGGTNSLKNLQTLCIDCNQKKKKAMANPEFMKRMKPDGVMNWLKHQFENDSILSLFGISPISRRKFCDSDW